jgi:hypothetical protein
MQGPPARGCTEYCLGPPVTQPTPAGLRTAIDRSRSSSGNRPPVGQEQRPTSAPADESRQQPSRAGLKCSQSVSPPLERIRTRLLSRSTSWNPSPAAAPGGSDGDFGPWLAMRCRLGPGGRCASNTGCRTARPSRPWSRWRSPPQPDHQRHPRCAQPLSRGPGSCRRAGRPTGAPTKLEAGQSRDLPSPTSPADQAHRQRSQPTQPATNYEAHHSDPRSSIADTIRNRAGWRPVGKQPRLP